MKTMFFVFFSIKGVVWFESIPHGQLAELILLKYWNGYMKLYVKKGLSFGPTTEFSTMTMLQLTSSFWTKN
jgi:hypothetical protein